MHITGRIKMKSKFYDKINGRDVNSYTIKNGNIEVDICDFGARINAIRINGIDIVLGFNSVENYFNSRSFSGATIGRVANRIAGGRFVLNHRPYFLNKNEGNNHLHGGNIGFDRQLFYVTNQTDSSVTMQYTSSDGEERYPGTLKFSVTFTVKDNSLLIEYSAVSDKDTLWNPTNHAYFNLDGEDSGDCRDNLLQIYSDFYTPTDRELIPTGEKKEVAKTVFDFNVIKKIGKDFGNENLLATNGYDHNYILKSEHAAHAESVKTDIKMDVYTDMPCIQLYTGGALKPCKGKTRNYAQWAGFCLEPQYCPNAINIRGFEKPILKKNEVKRHFIKFDFN